jgi:hypothetical protein
MEDATIWRMVSVNRTIGLHHLQFSFTKWSSEFIGYRWHSTVLAVCIMKCHLFSCSVTVALPQSRSELAEACTEVSM